MTNHYTCLWTLDKHFWRVTWRFKGIFMCSLFNLQTRSVLYSVMYSMIIIVILTHKESREVKELVKVECLSYFSVAMIKKKTWQKQIKETTIHFGSHFKVPSITMEKRRQQKVEAVALVVSAMEKKKEANALFSPLSLSYSAPKPCIGYGATHRQQSFPYQSSSR